MRREPRMVVVVGRVAEHEVVRAALAGQRAQRVLAEDGRVQPQLVEVRVDHAAGVAVRLDEGRRRGAARERLEAHRAGAGEQVEHVGVVDRADQVERVLAHAVGRRPRVAALRRRDPVAAVGAGDDPHAGAVTTWPSAAQASASRRSYTSTASGAT